MSRTALLLLWGFIFTFVACQSGDVRSLTDTDRAAIMKDINARYEAWVTAASETDIDKALAFFTPDVRAASNGLLFMSRDEVDKAFRPSFARLERQDIQTDETSVSVLSPDIAIQTVRGSFTATDTTGATSDRRALALTVDWVKREGQWVIVQFHQSFAPMQN
jgi:uncharacterized protein (TIGR02246 family)